MNSKEFARNVLEKSIKNGTIFNVLNNKESIGEVGVIRDTIVYLEFKNSVIPSDLLIGDYEFEEVKEG